MPYHVEGIVAKRDVLERHRRRYHWARIAPLKQGYGLVPIVEESWILVRERVSEEIRQSSGEANRDYSVSNFRHDLFKLSWALDDWMEEASKDGPTAVNQVMCDGGDCEHGTAVWADGRRALAPAVMQSFERSFDNPVNQALRRIGVDAMGSVDEFAAIGLPEIRSQDAWEAEAKYPVAVPPSTGV